jgi:hypothetical protein
MGFGVLGMHMAAAAKRAKVAAVGAAESAGKGVCSGLELVREEGRRGKERSSLMQAEKAVNPPLYFVPWPELELTALSSGVSRSGTHHHTPKHTPKRTPKHTPSRTQTHTWGTGLRALFAPHLPLGSLAVDVLVARLADAKGIAAFLK